MSTKSISDIRAAIAGNPLVYIVKDTPDALIYLMVERIHLEGAIEEVLNVIVDLIQHTFVTEGDGIISEEKESVGTFSFTAQELEATFPNINQFIVAFSGAAIAKYLAPPPVPPPPVPSYPFNPADDLPPPTVPL